MFHSHGAEDGLTPSPLPLLPIRDCIVTILFLTGTSALPTFASAW